MPKLTRQDILEALKIDEDSLDVILNEARARTTQLDLYRKAPDGGPLSDIRMPSPPLATIRVRRKDSGHVSVINRSDFDSDIHEEVEPVIEKKKKRKKLQLSKKKRTLDREDLETMSVASLKALPEWEDLPEDENKQLKKDDIIDRLLGA